MRPQLNINRTLRPLALLVSLELCFIGCESASRNQSTVGGATFPAVDARGRIVVLKERGLRVAFCIVSASENERCFGHVVLIKAPRDDAVAFSTSASEPGATIVDSKLTARAFSFSVRHRLSRVAADRTVENITIIGRDFLPFRGRVFLGDLSATSPTVVQYNDYLPPNPAIAAVEDYSTPYWDQVAAETDCLRQIVLELEDVPEIASFVEAAKRPETTSSGPE